MRSLRLGPAEVRFTDSTDGDFVPVPGTDPSLTSRRHVIADFPWTWLRQVHGADVVVVDAPGKHAGAAADAAVAVVPEAPVAVVTADCAPVVVVDEGGAAVAVAHAGWRGLMEGVLEATVATMRAHGATRLKAALGPCIHSDCYEFGAADLDTVAARFGDDVRATTRAGTPALDVPAAVRTALRALDVELVDDAAACTACTPGFWSHRARKDASRQATVAWLS